jgi:hypothetical protein
MHFKIRRLTIKVNKHPILRVEEHDLEGCEDKPEEQYWLPVSANIGFHFFSNI